MELFEQDIIENPDLNLSLRKKTSFTGDVLRLVSGTAFAQALMVLVVPFLTRLYAPEAFGVMALFGSITGILIAVACMRYELAIMLPETDTDAVNLLGVSLIFVLVISLLSLPIVFLGQKFFWRLLNGQNFTLFLFLIPFSVFIGGTFLALNYWNSRTKHFSRLSLARVVGSATTVSIQLGAGGSGHTSGINLIGASVAGQAASTALLGWRIWRADRKLFLGSIRWGKMLTGLKRHRKFPLYSSWSALLNAASLQLPVIMLAVFFSPVIVGFYALGYRVLRVPVELIGNAVAQVFYQRASVAKAGGSLSPIVEKTFLRLISLAVFPFFLIMIIGSDIFLVVFGQKWAEAGAYVQILAPWLFLVFLGSPISTLSTVIEKQEIGLLFNFSLIISRVASLLIGGFLGNIILALVLFSISGTCLWVGLCIYLLFKTGVKVKHVINYLISQFLLSGLFILPVFFIKYVFGASSLLILSVGSIAGILFYLNFFLREEKIRKLAVNFIFKRK